jgi:integrase
MASLHKQKNRPFWYCAFITPDGKRHFKSTKATDKKQARAIANEWERAVREGRRGLLTPEKARDVIARGVAEVFAVTNRETLPESTLGAWLTHWLEQKGVEASEGTAKRYKDIVESFRSFMGNHCSRDIASISATTITKWRDAEAKRVSRSTVNLSVKVIRSCFGDALKQGLLTSNPAKQVPTISNLGGSTRRGFTIAEIKRLLDKAGEKSEWRGMILFGLYSAQRLGDLATMTWRAIDLERGELALTTGKTGRRMILPLVKPLRDYLATVDVTDDPDAFIFPNKAKAYQAGSLSGQFHDLMVEAGLASERTHLKAKQGRNTKRVKSEISFHSLRHSAVTFLKAAGVSDALAREIAGHGSAAVSKIYTHIDAKTIGDAINKMTDVTG